MGPKWGVITGVCQWLQRAPDCWCLSTTLSDAASPIATSDHWMICWVYPTNIKYPKAAKSDIGRLCWPNLRCTEALVVPEAGHQSRKCERRLFDLCKIIGSSVDHLVVIPFFSFLKWMFVGKRFNNTTSLPCRFGPSLSLTPCRQCASLLMTPISSYTKGDFVQEKFRWKILSQGM